MKIKQITARQILDSRGNPTVEADVILENDTLGRASVPSGASTAVNEAVELRDNDISVYDGKGVLRAVENIKTQISKKLIGMDVLNQTEIDNAMINLDGTPNKSRLGANAILAVSLAVAHAASIVQKIPLYEHIHKISNTPNKPKLPMPMINIINGGAHAQFASDIQEFMIIPLGAATFSDAIRMSVEVFHGLAGILKTNGYPPGVGDEGGYAPVLRHGNSEALDMICSAITEAKYKLGQDFVLGLDIAASQLYKDGRYHLNSDSAVMETSQMIDWIGELTKKYPIRSIEDGLAEDDWDGWVELTRRFGDNFELIGDDLLVTNPTFLQKAIEVHAGNAILIKLNQIGTLTETIATTLMAQTAGFRTVISHRSGETEDTSLAHLAVGLATGQIKTGSLSRGERTAKYNELFRIESMLGPNSFK